MSDVMIPPIPSGIAIPFATPADVAAAIAAQAVVDLALDGAAYNPRPAQAANTMVLMGDSITHNNNGSSGSVTARSIRGYWNWAQMFLGHRFDLLNNAGVSANHVEDMVARFTTDVLAYGPAWCLIEGGVNNVSTNTAAFIEAQLLSMYQTCVANGIRPIATTITPADATTAGGLDNIYAVNDWMKWTLPHLVPGIIVVDWNAAVAKPADGHWGSASGRTLTFDGLHPAAQGAAWMGWVLALILSPLVPVRDLHIRGTLDKNGLGPNPGMTGSAGTAQTGVTGSVADSWTVDAASGSITAVAAKVTRTDYASVQASGVNTIHGIWQQVAASADTGSVRALFSNDNVGTDWNVGDEVYAQCEFQADGDFDPAAGAPATPTFILTLLAQTAGSASTLWTGTDMLPAGDVITPSDMFRTPNATTVYTLKTPSFVIPVNTVRLRVQIQYTGTGTVRFASGTIIKGSAPC